MIDSNGKLFFAAMFLGKETYNNAVRDLTKEYGEIKKESHEYDFDEYTDYYEKESGKNLIKKIIIFKKEIKENDLAEIKKFAAEIEKKYSVDGKRKINIDPGYVSKEKVVLASFKKKDFKEYLGWGIFLHKVLEFNDGKVKDFFHTFPDFKSKFIQGFFLELIKQDL